jgi:hypothetical protein
MSKQLPNKNDQPGTTAFNLDDVVAGARGAVIESYNQRYDTYMKQNIPAAKRRALRAKAGASEYSTECIRSFRSACVAKEEMSAQHITYTQIAKLHKIKLTYANTVRVDFTRRPDCLPTDELVNKFKAKFAEGMAEIRVLKAQRPTTKMTVKDVAAVSRATRAMDWQTLQRHMKRQLGKDPVDGISALILVQDLLERKLMKPDQARTAVDLIQKNMWMFASLIPVEGEDNAIKDSK